jgi:hypothetical protein
MATLLNNATSVGAGAPYRASGPNRSFQAVVSGTGAVSATVVVEGSNDVDASANPQNWLLLGTITLSGTNSATDGFPSNTNWMFVRMRISAISGTNAAVRGGVEVS